MESVRLRRLGMTPEQYNESLKKIQACEICGKSIEDNGRGLAIDHCHTTGNFRGMLCTNCNTALGLFHDDINTLKSAIKYLRK